MEVQFGSSNNKWTISPPDFTFQELQDGSCLGSFFELPASPGTTTPPIIMGDTFLVSCFCFWDSCSVVPIVPLTDRIYVFVNRKTFTLSSVPTRLRWASRLSRLLQSIRMELTFPLPLPQSSRRYLASTLRVLVYPLEEHPATPMMLRLHS